MTFIKINQTNYYYELHGKGPALVFINGYTTSCHWWDRLYPHFTDQYQVLIFDNRGFGKTQDDGSSFTIDTMAKETMQLIEELGLKQPVLVGFSMGGNIVQSMAMQFYKKIEKIILLNTLAKWRKAFLFFNKALLDTLTLEEVPFEYKLNLLAPWLFGSDAIADKSLIHALGKFVSEPSKKNDILRQQHALLHFDSLSELKNIDIPTLVIRGDEDIVALPSEVKILADNIPQAELVTLNTGHCSFIEKPIDVAKNIFLFLEQ